MREGFVALLIMLALGFGGKIVAGVAIVMLLGLLAASLFR